MYNRLPIALTLVAAVAGALIAEKKGRSWLLWGLLCAVFPFIIILVFLLPAKLKAGNVRRCPFCGNFTSGAASSCSHCGREFPIDLLHCPGCGKYVPSGEYCIECGEGLHQRR